MSCHTQQQVLRNPSLSPNKEQQPPALVCKHYHSQELDESTDSDDTGDTDEVEVVKVLLAGEAGAEEERTPKEVKSETNEYEAEVLIHLSQAPRLSNATFTAEAWDEVATGSKSNQQSRRLFCHSF